MEKDHINPKRPGRKALFVGATTRPSSAEEKVPDESGREFAGLILETLEKFNSGEKEARIQEEKAGEQYINAAKSINRLLDSHSDESLEKETGDTKELESQITLLEDKIRLSGEELETAQEEISRLNEILKEKEGDSFKQDNETQKALEDKYSGEIEELRNKIAQKEEDLQNAESELIKAGGEKEQLEAQYEVRLKQYAEKISGLEETNSRLSKERDESGKESAKSEELRQAIDRKDTEIRSLQAEIKKSTGERETLVRQSGEKIEQYTQKISGLNQKISELEEKNRKLSASYNELSLKEKTEKEDIEAKIAEINTLKQRSETIVQQNPMPILLMTKKFDIIVANQAFEEMSGIPLQNLTKMSARDFRILNQEGKGLKYTLENKVRGSGEVEIEMPSGIHILEQYSIPILNEKKEITNLLAVYNDITEIRRKNAEIEELRLKEQEEARLLAESAETITGRMVDMTSGDLTVSVEIFDDDPLGVLKTNFNKSVEGFRELLSDINEKTNIIERTSDELSNNSDDIAKANENLALASGESAEFLKNLMERFENISLGISDLSASIEEISSTSQEVTKQANQAAVEGKDAAEIGKEASEKMETVGEISQQSVNEINLLNQEMYKINEIIKLIRGIAEQTNMLALNAAIEAARAGEHGRGFSVVAGEIRNLAGESKEATQKIELLISEIQKNSDKTANSMKQADEEIQTGIESVNQAVEALHNIAKDIEVASRGITEISHATETQANEINSFMRNIEEANSLTRGNLEKIEGMAAMAEEISATTEEVGSISHEMHNLSADLQITMKKFRMD